MYLSSIKQQNLEKLCLGQRLQFKDDLKQESTLNCFHRPQISLAWHKRYVYSIDGWELYSCATTSSCSSQIRVKQGNEVCGCYSITLLNWTPTYIRMVCGLGDHDQRINPIKTQIFFWLRLVKFINYSTLNNEHSWEDMISVKKPTNMHFR